MITRIIVIGGGPGGYAAALEAANLGASVTVIEKQELGGTCLNQGCIPSKIMKHSADAFVKIQKAEQYGINIEGQISFDMPALIKRKDKIISSQRKAVEAILKKRNIIVEKASAYIQSKNSVLITLNNGEKKVLEYDKLIIATGTKPLKLNNLIFDHKTILSSDDLLDLDKIPESLVIVGAGVIGCEFAFIFSSLGTQVTLVEGMSRVLPFPNVDSEISKLLLREMKKKKIKVYLDTIVTSSKVEDDTMTIDLDVSPFTDNEKPKPLKNNCLKAEKMGVCTGRSPNIDQVGISNIGLTSSRDGWIQVNSQCETIIENIYAVGDILGPERIMLAHVASHEGIVAANNAMGKYMKMSYSAVPLAIFTMPEIAMVGLSQEQACEKGVDIKTVSVNFRNIGKAHAIDQIAGMVLLVLDNSTDMILGVHIIGPSATELIGEAVIAVQNKMKIQEFADTIHAHPTLSEIMGEVFLKANGRPIHG